MTARQEPEAKAGERDQQRENAERLGDGEAENQVAELALRGGRIAQRSRQVIAEDDADADAGAAHADTGNAGSDVFCARSGPWERSFQGPPVFRERGAPGGPSVARVNRIVEIDAGENGEDVGLQESDQQLERREHDDEYERQGGAEPANERRTPASMMMKPANT